VLGSVLVLILGFFPQGLAGLAQPVLAALRRKPPVQP